jgi:thiol-disulfide isomerase/thioredoxin
MVGVVVGVFVGVGALLAAARPVWGDDKGGGASGEVRESMLVRSAGIADAAASGVGRTVADVQVVSLRGVGKRLSEIVRERPAVVIVMTAVACPVSKKYGPRLAELEREFGAKGVAFVFVNVVDADTKAEMQEQIDALGWKGTYSDDPGDAIIAELRPKTTTEVFVLDAALRLTYRGAVDDQFRVGGAASGVTRHFLRDALLGVLAGKVPEVSATIAPGCLVDLPPENALATPVAGAVRNRGLTYQTDIAPILARHCVSCHRAGGEGPFALDGPGTIAGRAAMIEAVLRDGLMPPTHGARVTPDGVAYAGVRAMGDEHREKVIDWLRSGRALGAAPAAAQGGEVGAPAVRDAAVETRGATEHQLTWTIGPPDAILLTPFFAPRLDGALQHQRAYVATDFAEDAWVDAIECKPLMKDTLHHALVWLVEPGEKLPTREQAVAGAQLLAAYSPGDGVTQYAGGQARRIPAGSLLVVDMYSRAVDRTMGRGTARLRVGLRWAPKAPAAVASRKEVRSLVLADDELRVGAGAVEVREFSSVLEQDTRVVALRPYARGRGREVRVRATTPDGRAFTLLDLGAFDFRWQMRYPLAAHLDLPRGTRIDVRGVLDNTLGNPLNPDHMADVLAGSAAGDEALLVSIEAVLGG